MDQHTQVHGTAEDCVELTKAKLLCQIPTSSRFSNSDSVSCDGLSSLPQFFRSEQYRNNMRVDSKIPKSVVHQDGKPLSSFLESFGILKNVGTQLGLWNGESVNGENNVKSINLVSTNELIRMAGENIINASSSGVDHITEVIHPYYASISGISDEGRRDVAVIQQLLASAEKVGQQKFDSARILLNQCEEYSSKGGNPIQRLVYYFSAALRLKISQATEGITSHDLVKMKTMEIKDSAATQNSAFIALHLKVPFCQVSQFTATNVIIEDVVHSRKIHIIELAVRDGLQCTIIMQALADRLTCPVEHLKVTAVGTTSLKKRIEETGEQLTSFAKSMNLSFSFNLVVIDDMLDLNKSLFELDDDEAVAVYSSCFLHKMVGRKDRLECLMKVLISLKPCVMVVSEIEANHNSPVFVNRFIEALFYYGAFFDCMEDCMSDDNEYRNFLEYAYFGPSIHNIVAAEGEERTIRHVKANVWSQFFARFKVVQKELSMTSLYQATLVSKKFSCGSSCSLDMDGKSLIIGWKGTPVLSVSAWKFLE